MPGFRDLSKEVFKDFKVIRLLSRDSFGKAKWLCRCKCGNTFKGRGDSLVTKSIRSCGCARIVHGHFCGDVPTPEYRSWDHMKQRCLNPKNHAFKDYGGRGIRICKRWLKSFTCFLEDMGPRPLNRSLDRINVNGNYTPSNCRWATSKQQMNNRRDNAA